MGQVGIIQKLRQLEIGFSDMNNLVIAGLLVGDGGFDVSWRISGDGLERGELFAQPDIGINQESIRFLANPAVVQGVAVFVGNDDELELVQKC
jgi:hypothetical protein